MDEGESPTKVDPPCARTWRWDLKRRAVAEALAEGLDAKKAGAVAGVSRATVERWKLREEFSEAVDKAREARYEEWSEQLDEKCRRREWEKMGRGTRYLLTGANGYRQGCRYCDPPEETAPAGQRRPDRFGQDPPEILRQVLEDVDRAFTHSGTVE